MFGSKVATKYLAWGGFEHFERVETFGVNSQELRRGLFSEGITPTGSVSRTTLTNEQYHMDEWTSNGYVQNWCKTATIITAIIVFRRDKSKFNRIWVVSQFVDGFLRLKTSKTPSLKGPTSSCSSFFVSRVAPHFETHEIGKKTTSHRPMACFWHCGHDHGNLEAWPWWLDKTVATCWSSEIHHGWDSLVR